MNKRHLFFVLPHEFEKLFGWNEQMLDLLIDLSDNKEPLRREKKTLTDLHRLSVRMSDVLWAELVSFLSMAACHQINADIYNKIGAVAYPVMMIGLVYYAIKHDALTTKFGELQHLVKDNYSNKKKTLVTAGNLLRENLINIPLSDGKSMHNVSDVLQKKIKQQTENICNMTQR